MIRFLETTEPENGTTRYAAVVNGVQYPWEDSRREAREWVAILRKTVRR